jgi:hypothetical protein
MKIKTLFSICLLLGFGLTQLSAQNGKGGTGTFQYKVWDDPNYFLDIPVYCNNAVVDRLTGSADIHIVLHFQNEVLIWGNAQYDGVVTSELTHEKFETKENYHLDGTTWIGTCHSRLTGSLGTHYILTYILDENTKIFTFTKAVCN